MGIKVQRTALGPTLIVALDQYSDPPVVPDPWAARILPQRWRIPVRLGRSHAIRRSMIAATEKSVPGGWASLLCRKRYIDDAVREAVGRGLDAVVIIGAGYDTRAYRVPELAGIPIWEVDLPANVTAKSEGLARCFGRVPPEVGLVAADLETDSLMERLTGSGYDLGMTTFFVWESVTMYLPEQLVRRTLRELSGAVKGSELVFTHFRRDFLDGTALHGADNAYRRFVVREGLWKFGLNPEDVGSFLAEFGWQVMEQPGPSAYRERYLVPAGRSEPVSEIERAVRARR
ncbi:methyltransferase [Mycolicibacterium conceptionense]|uniref:class I SAM-dependent methyltransferase n=1 Tax=Mycolicibacterium conceptionense TaxID=451644 RepID=UPI0007ECFA1F|nr:SAM-dependent methyltransferase [Mycolicibacterium conceptionense]OBK06210.1 methyltransferase [Mycolicibacterium conceptionense]OMB69890.1 methyltransferase [Mycolicibacterium conceptionense]OMB83529.1 methyltransferase [Mycolicibacterium conceptionense]